MLVRELQAALGSATVMPGRKRACVALLLRLSPAALRQNPEVTALMEAISSPEVTQSRAKLVEAIFNSVNVEDLEAFFILRASNENDRWGGQVGLPGGRQDVGESDLETAAREVLEEVGLILPGLDLSEIMENPRIARIWSDLEDKCDFKNNNDRRLESRFEVLGRVHDRKVLQGPDGLVVSGFVFMQVATETPHINPEHSEVAACGWCPLNHLLGENVASPMAFSIAKMTFPQEHPGAFKVMEMLGLDDLYFTKVSLPMNPLYISAHADPNSGRALTTLEVAASDTNTEVAVREAFFLWGMTLGIINDLLTDMTGLRKERIGVSDTIVPGWVKVEKIFASKIHNLGLHTLRRGYQLTFSEPMPWSLYMMVYPIMVLGCVSGPPLVAAAKFFRSRM